MANKNTLICVSVIQSSVHFGKEIFESFPFNAKTWADSGKRRLYNGKNSVPVSHFFRGKFATPQRSSCKLSRVCFWVLNSKTI